ncbi:unnamed protein product [Tilletia laevis]|nr:hypothetical protein CF336_g5210 [Tilletia laevis]KAE8198021.1 hypothetical protein CF335_g4475 [Tilletia laevis]CAD6930772.1 unnamed protein product [Tilletia laevis]
MPAEPATSNRASSRDDPPAASSSSSFAYPPPPRRRSPPPRRSPFTPRPGGRLDRFRRKYTDPSLFIYALLGLFLISFVVPIPLPFFSDSYRVFHGGRSASSVSKSTRAVAETACCCASSGTSCPAATTSAVTARDSDMGWQKTFALASRSKGCHLIQKEVEREISEGIKDVKVGMLYLFIQHTSAALTLNENYDPDVRTDMDAVLDKIVPMSFAWKHTDEGPDDSASHTKASLIGPTVTIPITNGRLNLGTWQGVYLCEFRKDKHTRKIVATVLS